MGVLHLCSHGLASVPYYIENIALNVYSLEELCYYLKQNIDLVDPSFMDTELISWIREELKLVSLAEKLSDLKKKNGGLAEFAAVLAGSCNYCTREEVEKIRQTAADFENKSEAECRKIRADRLLIQKRYGASILEYEKLLEFPETKGVVEGNIYHNLGTAYAGLFFFQKAASCYEKAFQKNENPLSLKHYHAALKLSEGADLPKQTAEDETLLPESKLEQWKEDYVRDCK